MGCLNSKQNFNHWFGNIHLSGGCNRSCYFCIGQNMMELDPLDTLKTWPLPGVDVFIEKCLERGVKDVFLTGTNTDPLLYHYCQALSYLLKQKIPDCRFGIRTNAAAVNHYFKLKCFDMGSVTICSFDPYIYKKMMGSGSPPDIKGLVLAAADYNWIGPPKVNVVLGPENAGLSLRAGGDLMNTIIKCAMAGVRRINLREPYGQAHIGNPLTSYEKYRIQDVHGMPTYEIAGCHITYWDVHYCEVESVNLYANGKVSEDYPITRGHSDNGTVLDQSNFGTGRHTEQWVTLSKK
jgi:hypothetical protein